MKKRICVLGAGAFGSSLAQTWASLGLEVSLWGRDRSLAEQINVRRVNGRYWPDFALHSNISAFSDLRPALLNCSYVVYACPSSVFRRFLIEIKTALLGGPLSFVDTSKGIDPNGLKLHHQVAQDELGQNYVDNHYLCLSGPSFAAELMRQTPTCVTLSCRSESRAKEAQLLLGGPAFRTLTSSDLVASELGGAMKNVIAIAVGIAEGMGFGLNTQAALITRGLAEMARLGLSLGARTESFLGLSGVGDLVLTCTGSLSRNRSFGLCLGQGLSRAEAEKKVNSTIEGINSTKNIFELAQKQNVEVPICEQAFALIFEGKPLQKAFEDILSRPLRDEWHQK